MQWSPRSIIWSSQSWVHVCSLPIHYYIHPSEHRALCICLSWQAVTPLENGFTRTSVCSQVGMKRVSAFDSNTFSNTHSHGVPTHTHTQPVNNSQASHLMFLDIFEELSPPKKRTQIFQAHVLVNPFSKATPSSGSFIFVFIPSRCVNEPLCVWSYPLSSLLLGILWVLLIVLHLACKIFTNWTMRAT